MFTKRFLAVQVSMISYNGVLEPTIRDQDHSFANVESPIYEQKQPFACGLVSFQYPVP
ncbi:MAG: hypothetical protein HW380_1810 [Magnetococcales bacterium]|nr:hypothetical protein [Magnetococcales bacterium]